ncbi:MerR family transcriptional regulator [Paenibacillus filicis]|uniref:MerR family transcriptional regulator n=1 Tax=Paenibacillus gyeongsangnamensis TaxID=3388067 RepID=A0ABT4QKK5_9BACL|nr:MerR family transcriptional regulator [Paenibacillus filicis]MCZ8517392.1 MerR family transcriptional regulator [Paenibacillus filicis]
MKMWTTKEAAEALNVSPTTIKRWASHFVGRFTKDEWGHYVFSENDLEKLSFIKKQLDQRLQLNQIEFDAQAASMKQAVLETAAASADAAGFQAEQLAEYCHEMKRRCDSLEYKLSTKADEVVSIQLLEHRRELDDLTRSVKLLLQNTENLNQSINLLQKRSEAFFSVPQTAKKKTLLASLFQL